jgi:hypothetical protein
MPRATAALMPLLVMGLALAACRATGDGPESTAGGTAPAPDASRPTTSIPLCGEVPRISAPAELYRDSPIYVGNEMPAQEIQAWAEDKPGFEEIWIDRDHGGWVTVAFSTDAAARQAELADAFPGVGVVAVEVGWTMRELEDLQQRVGEELGPLLEVSTGISVQQGVVNIGVGVLDPKRLAEIEARFGEERICVEGTPPEQAPADGPQPLSGDGWRLLADEQGVGEAYRTGIASDEDSYRDLWESVGLATDRPPVDFESEVVIWFGAVYGSSCPEIRLDDVLTDLELALVHADIVLIGGARFCTADANPRAYVVALERSKLPGAPFAIQLNAEDPPPGAPEERTIVEADLSVPGAVARPDQVHGDPSLPLPNILGSGAIIETGYPATYGFSTHCGIAWLGEINSVRWRTDAADIPAAWTSAVDDAGFLVVEVLLETDPEPMLTATANGHSVTYVPTLDEQPDCD